MEDNDKKEVTKNTEDREDCDLKKVEILEKLDI